MSGARHTSEAVGLAFGLVAALFYTGASVCLRYLTDCDPAWVSCVKALPTVVFAGWLATRSRGPAGSRSLDAPTLGLLIAAGLVAQLVGNAGNQWSLGIIGLALCVPLTFGALMAASAVVARLWLGERLSVRSLTAIFLLLLAMLVLQWGAAGVPLGEDRAKPSADWWVSAGVLAACASGVAYALQAAVIRVVSQRNVPLSRTLLVFSTTGVVSLGAVSLLTAGWQAMAETRAADLAMMLAAGGFNAVAFFCLSKSLSLAPVVQANAINATQTAMAALAGILLFAEPFTPFVGMGLVLTIGGTLLLGRQK